jgi:hypothetical protein
VTAPSIGPSSEPANAAHCILHTFEAADRVCVACGGWHCDACLVTPWGPRKGALCVTCALERGGVRKGSGRAPQRSEREIRQLERDRIRQQRDEDRRPLVISPVGLQKLDVPEDKPARKGLFRRRKQADE